jgi:sucrose-6-phosphate hydrolase SacC (GH32 family)
LDAGQGANDELCLTGDQFTALIRLRCRATTLWSTRGFFTKGGGHDQLVFNFFSYDFEKGRPGMRVGCEIGLEGQKGLGGQVTALVEQIGAEQWHDLVARYDGRELTLFVDGVALDRKPASGQLRQGNREPVTIGAGGAGDNPFPGSIDHAALWNRALSDEDVVVLSGGRAEVESHRTAFAAYVPPPQEPQTSQLVDQSRLLAHKFQNDRHRPRYHFLTPEEGEIMPGDPNGAIWWKGRYHLFYIFQRHQAAEPQTVHCWGHASSVDLLHWEHHPTALDVAPDDPDRGIFSGNALVNKDGVPVLLYHGVSIGNCIALAQDDRLVRWQKSSSNPIVAIPKQGEPGYGKYDSWDPHGWLEGNTYFAIFGGNPGTGAPATLFRGPELTQLKYVGPLLTNDSWSEPGEDVSCPDFFQIGDKHMLLCISHMRGARYFLGQWKNERFVAESHGRMNWPGGSFFAPESLRDDRGRRILWAWCLDERPRSDRIASGWSGVMSLPRVLSLDNTRTLKIEPVEELQQLRVNGRSRHNVQLAADSEVALPEMQGDCLEVSIELQPREAQQTGLKVRRTPDGAEETSIYYDAQSQQLSIDVSKSTLDQAIRYKSWCLFQPPDAEDRARRITLQSAPLALEPGEPLRLRVFIDHSMLEVFANGRQCMTQRVWPTRDDASGVALFSRGGAAEVTSFEAWEMAATSPE